MDTSNAERPLARSVVARQRFSRIFSLGDRKKPLSWTPGLVRMTQDPEIPTNMCIFQFERDNSKIPALLSLSSLHDICLPFGDLEIWNAQEGLILPPSLVDSDSGSKSSGNQFLPISWQSMHHDSTLLDDELEPSVIALIDAPQLAERPGMLIDAIHALKSRFPTSLIWTPGIGGPDNCALLSWIGVDLFDLSRSHEASARGILLTEEGPRNIEETVAEDCGINSQINAWKRAIAATRTAIRQGTLRELVERQALSSPRSVERLRRHDAKISEIASKDPGSAGLESSVKNGTRLRCHSFTSREDPLIVDWKRRVSDLHTPPSHQSKVLVLLPCSAQKPYRLSQSHRRFQRSIKTRGVNEVMVTAPLGLVPRELEDIWPAAHYDIPVTGDWDLDEKTTIISMIEKYANRNGFLRIINHSGIDLKSDQIDIIDTRQGSSAGSSESLSRLEIAIDQASKELELDNPKESIHRLEKLKSLSRFQYGTDEWLEGARVSGRPPIFKIEIDKTQIALWNPRRGGFSFSKASLNLLDGCNALPRIEINTGFDWKGDIFSTNLKTSDSGIRLGDEVLVFQDGSLIGSARATASGWEWPRGPGRLAKAQHRL
tara:strand:- start:10521 stop:12326 length:1806 start_codon:yes stop_codon:yes gene_type:complete